MNREFNFIGDWSQMHFTKNFQPVLNPLPKHHFDRELRLQYQLKGLQAIKCQKVADEIQKQNTSAGNLNALVERSAFFVFQTMLVLLSLVGCGNDELSQVKYFPGNIVGSSVGEKVLSLTFDDGPSEYTLPLARWLASRQIKASFFVVGRNVPGREDTLKELKDLGHLVANHSYNHKLMTSLSLQEAFEEISSTHRLIAPYVDQGHFLFRSPYGGWSAALSAFINGSQLNFYAGNIFWDIGGTLTDVFAADWACWRDQLAVVECGKRYEAEIANRGRGIVLMHDITSQTAAMTRFLVPRLQEKGYQFVRADEIPRVIQALKPQQGNLL